MAEKPTPENPEGGKQHLLRWIDKNLPEGGRVEVVEHVPELPTKDIVNFCEK